MIWLVMIAVVGIVNSWAGQGDDEPSKYDRQS